MTPPRLLDLYRYGRLQENFSRQIQEDFDLPDAQVVVTSSTLTDLDNDGEHDDLAGTALLQVGSRARGLIFLMREDGETRFLETDGNPFNPAAELRFIPCSESRPWHCPSTLDRARRYIRPARISIAEYDRELPGRELLIRRGGGLWAIVNSLEAFLR